MPTSQDEKPGLEIGITEVEEANRRPRPPSEDKLGFGVFLSDHMLQMTYNKGKDRALWVPFH